MSTRRDELFEALCEACGLDWNGFTKRERGKVNAACKELREVGATPFMVHQRAGQYRREFKGAAMTPTAISGQWSYLGSRIESARASSDGPVAVCRVKGHQFEWFASFCLRCGREPKPEGWTE